MSSNNSGWFSKSVGTPDLRLFAEIFRFLNLLFPKSFFRISERADTVKNFPERKRKIGKFSLKQPDFRDDFSKARIALIGQKCLFGKLNNSIFSVFPPFVFGFLMLIDMCFAEIVKSAHVQLEEGSKEFECFVSNSIALKDPKYPKQIQAQTTFLLCFFHFFSFRIFLSSTSISKIKGSVGVWQSFCSERSIPRTRNFAVSFCPLWFSKPSSFEIDCRAER